MFLVVATAWTSGVDNVAVMRLENDVTAGRRICGQQPRRIASNDEYVRADLQQPLLLFFSGPPTESEETEPQLHARPFSLVEVLTAAVLVCGCGQLLGQRGQVPYI